MTRPEQKNHILAHLKNKHLNEWTPETNIEKELEGDINYYVIRQLLPELYSEKMLDYSRFSCSYKITTEGRKFIINGGYK